MNKTLFTIAIVFFTLSAALAQDFSLSWDGYELNDTVNVWGAPDTNEIRFNAMLHNHSDIGINVKVRRNQLEIIEGTSNQFRWGTLYEPEVDTSISHIYIPSGGSSQENAFYGLYVPNLMYGTSFVEYIFYNADNEDQSIIVLVKYWISPTDVNEDLMKGGYLSDIYPNPASNSVNINYTLTSSVNNAVIRIIDIYGAVVKEARVDHNDNQLNMNISDLGKGFYFYTFIINGNVYETKKLIVQ